MVRKEMVVVKIGGNALEGGADLDAIAHDAAAVMADGGQVIVVFGGGPQIDEELERRGIRSVFQKGLRVTSAPMLEAVRAALCEQVGPSIVAAFAAAGLVARLIPGDEGMLRARRRTVDIDGESSDWGYVGEVVGVETGSLDAAFAAGEVPVVAGIAADEAGQRFNVNADTAAGAIAGALGADRLVMLTDVAGLLASWPDESSLIPSLTATELAFLLPTLGAGMIPKMEACLRAVEAGAQEAVVVDGRVPHCVARALDDSIPFGTKVVAHEQREVDLALAGRDDAGVPPAVADVGAR